MSNGRPWWERPQFWISIITCVVGTVLPALGLDLGHVSDFLQVLGAGNAGRHATQPPAGKKG